MTLALPLRLEGIQIIDANGVMVALVRGEMADYRERGAQIVNAVNSHTALLAVAKEALDNMNDGRPDFHPSIRDVLESAIASAGEQTL